MALYVAKESEVEDPSWYDDDTPADNTDAAPPFGDSPAPQTPTIPVDPDADPVYTPGPIEVDEEPSDGGDPDDDSPGGGPDINNLDPGDWELQYVLNFSSDSSVTPPGEDSPDASAHIGVNATVRVQLHRLDTGERYTYGDIDDMKTIVNAIGETVPECVDLVVVRDRSETDTANPSALALWDPRSGNWIQPTGAPGYSEAVSRTSIGLEEIDSGLSIAGGTSILPKINTSDAGQDELTIDAWINGVDKSGPAVQTSTVTLDGME